MMFKGIVLNGCLIKLEKYDDDDKKIAECGIDSSENKSRWGEEQPLRSEYEKWVSEGGIPVYQDVEKIPDQLAPEIILQSAKTRKKKEV